MSQRLRHLWFFVSAFPVPAAVGFVAVGSLLAYRLWQPLAPETQLGLSIASAVAAFGCVDLLLLTALPHRRLSFGPVGLPLFLVTLLRLLGVWAIASVLRWTEGVWGWPPPHSMFMAGTMVVWFLNAAVLVCEIYGLYYEPFDVRVTRLPLNIPDAAPGKVLRLVQLSDLHVERITKREHRILEKVERLRPDLLVLTGDYLNGSYLEDKRARRDAHWFLSNLRAPLGVFAVTAKYGDTPEAVAEMFGGVDIQVLRDEASRVEASGGDLWLVGISCLGRERDAQAFSDVMRGVPDNSHSVLLYHTTDLAASASEAGINLYLTGHTHGGQIRLPLFGALYTNIRSWKKYERGLYHVGKTSMYVSRGLGMEGRGGPRARFLCPPEIVAVDLTLGKDLH